MNGYEELLPSPNDSSPGSNNELLPTQPIEENESLIMPAPDTTDPWAYLSSSSEHFKSFDIRKDTFLLGRQPEADYVLQSPALPDEALKLYSRRHFSIVKRKDAEDLHLPIMPILEDESMAGTWVNGEKIGKGHSRPLVHGDVISVLHEEHRVFR